MKLFTLNYKHLLFTNKNKYMSITKQATINLISKNKARFKAAKIYMNENLGITFNEAYIEIIKMNNIQIEYMIGNEDKRLIINE